MLICPLLPPPPGQNRGGGSGVDGADSGGQGLGGGFGVREKGEGSPRRRSPVAARAEAARVGLAVMACGSVRRCNTRFIKEHKPSNHIRARIKSHVYTTE